MTLRFHIAGIPHRKPARLPNVGDTITLVPEPTNQFDPNAIKTMFDMGGEAGVVHIGYVPKTETESVRAFGLTSMKVVEVEPQRKWSEVILEGKSQEEGCNEVGFTNQS